MKTCLVSIIASGILGASTLLGQSFIGNATPSDGQSGVFAYWNFNGLSITTASSPGSGGVPTSLASDFGSATLSLTPWTGLVDDFSGSTINEELSSGAGPSLSLVGNTGNGSYIQFSFSMENLESLEVEFAVRGTSTGFNSGLWSYSTNGTDFTGFGSNTASTSTTFGTAGPISTTGLDNVTTAFLRYTLAGASSTSGNNRIDNLTLSATYAAPVPEPSAYAALAGVLVIGLAMYRRRRA